MSTLADLRSQFQLMAADDGTYWSPSEILTWINQAQTDFAIRTLSVRSSATIALTAGTPTYTLPAKTIRILRVVHNSKPIFRENEPRLDRLNATWMTATAGTPTAYLYGLEGATTIRFFPAPDVTAAGQTLTVLVAKTPTDLAADTDVSAVPAEYHHSLVLYSLAKAFMKDGDQRNPDKAGTWWQQYHDQVELATDYVARALNRGQMSGFDGSVRGQGPQVGS